METFKDIIGYNGVYKISNFGRVYNTKYDRFLKPGKLRNGYLLVVLCNNGVKKCHTVHRLVAEAFLPNPEKLPEVNHKDTNKENNYASNLEWCDSFYNKQYSSGKAVIQKKDGIVLKRFSCIKEAARDTGLNHSGISRCCNGIQNKYHGYEWEFVDGK